MLALLVTSIAAFYLLLNKSRDGDYTPIEIAKKGIDLIMKRVRLVEKKGGHKEWELVAKRAEFDKVENKINLEDIKATFYPVDRKPITIISKKGIVNNENKDIKLSGDIFIKSDEGYNLNTESLLWVASKRMLETDDFVKITGEHFKITGNGLISNIDSQDIKIKSRVEAVYY